MDRRAETERAVERYADMIRRICLCHLKSREDTEDVFQNVFLKYMLYNGTFDSDEHEKAWLIRVTVNYCQDFWRSLTRRRVEPLELLREEPALTQEDLGVWEAVLSLPEKYRDPIYLHYYEGYSAPEIARIVKTKENTVYSLLSRGRSMLREKLGGDSLGE